MTDSKPKITPPPYLMLAWKEEARGEVRDVANHFERQSIQMIKAANWGWQQRNASVATELQKARDEELLESCKWLHNARNHGLGYDIGQSLAAKLRAARRPKPKSQAEEALASLDGVALPEEAWQAVSAALERLREVEDDQ